MVPPSRSSGPGTKSVMYNRRDDLTRHQDCDNHRCRDDHRRDCDNCHSCERRHQSCQGTILLTARLL